MHCPFFGPVQAVASSHSFCVPPEEYWQQHWLPAAQVGSAVGATVGAAVGDLVGAAVGELVGAGLGASVGFEVGCTPESFS